MQIGVQYYQPPFPEERHWKEDLLKDLISDKTIKATVNKKKRDGF